MHFAVYFIPQNTNFYNWGSEVLGYDIVLQKKLCLAPTNVGRAHYFGFHLTITDAVFINSSNLSSITTNIGLVIKALNSNNLYTICNPKLKILGLTKNNLTIVYKPNNALVLLHYLLVSFIQSKGKSSFYTKNCYYKDYLNVAKVKLFHSPNIFENFMPHFTLFSNLNSNNFKLVNFKLLHANNIPLTLGINSVCLVIKPSNKKYFQIYKEFKLN